MYKINSKRIKDLNVCASTTKLRGVILAPRGRAMWLRQDTRCTSRQRETVSQTTSKHKRLCVLNNHQEDEKSRRRCLPITVPVRDPCAQDGRHPYSPK